MFVASIKCFEKNDLVNNSSNRQISFGEYNPTLARRVEAELAKKGITCSVGDNGFIAECYQKVVAVFEKLFGQSYLPKKLLYDDIDESAYAQYEKYFDTVTLNKKYNYGCYYNMDSLTAEAKKNYNSILPSWASSKHPAHTFVHEFSHAAHWHHLNQRHNFTHAVKVMEGLHYTQVPTSIGRLITKFKISKYAANSNMKEFLAERMTQDICEGLTDTMWIPYKDIYVDYSNIFSKKWNYRYSSPQSYVDYFTQQVWNGDIDEAKHAGQLAAAYLADIETSKVSTTVQKIATALDYTPSSATPENKPLLFKIGSFISSTLLGINEDVTAHLDKKNKLDLKL